MTPDSIAATQSRTLRLLFITQVTGGIGLAIGASVGALLAADMAGIGVSGLVQSATVMGGALLAVPLTRIVRRHGRRPSLATGYALAAAGALMVVAAAMTSWIPMLFAGFFLFGGGGAAGFQARYAAVDLAPPERYGRHMSLIVWATTIGAVVGPNLAYPAGAVLAPIGIPTLAGPFAFSAVLFACAAGILLLWLRPDPLRAAGRPEVPHAHVPAEGIPVDADLGMGAALRQVMAHPRASLGVAGTAIGHFVMVAVMAMTPVHIAGAGHSQAHTLRIVGVIISVHVAGMYAFAPAMGWLTDRLGRRSVIAGGVVVLLIACAVSGTAAHDSARLGIGLMLLGLGWSATMIAGSAMLTASTPPELRPSTQGLSDVIMGVAGASAGAGSGVVVQTMGFPALTALAALATLPLVALLFAGPARTPAAVPRQ